MINNAAPYGISRDSNGQEIIKFIAEGNHS